MQNLNDFDKLQQMQTVQQVSNQESAGKPALSRYDRFVNIAWIIVVMSFLAVSSYIIITSDMKTRKQIDANAEAALNSPKIQQYRAKEARRQREIAKQKRLRQLGIDGITEPMQKNDLLNEQLRKQELAERQERIANQKPQGVDYRSQLAAYNARLKEVQAEEARLRSEAEEAARAEAQARVQAKAQAARERAEQLRMEQESQAEEQRFLAEQRAQELAEAQARAAQERAERERAAKMKAAQEAAAKAAKLKAQLESLKTQKNTLQTPKNTEQTNH